MCDFWYDYVKAKYREDEKLCYALLFMQKHDIYKGIAEDVEIRFNT